MAQDLDGGVSLYYHNESDGLYYACETEVAYTGHMDELVSGHGSNGAFLSLSWRRTGAMPGWTPMYCSPPPRRAPWCTTPPTPSPSPDEATVSALQAAVSFQTQSDALYEIPGGLRLRVGRETLEIGNDGTVSYHTSEDAASRYPIGTTDGYTVSELVETTRRLAADTVGASCGAAQLYLMDITEGADGTTEVCYGYSLSGAAVLLPEDGCAARFTVRNGQIIDYTLRFRRYEETAEHSLLLPERQAAAALEALSPEGRELVVFIRIMAVTLWRPAGPPDRNDALWNGPN